MAEAAPAGTTYLLPERPVENLDDFLATGGGEGLVAARKLGPQAVVEEIVASGLRGRGGAGFPAGVKWRSVAAGGGRHYAVANGAEGEPATFKDRTLMRRDPYRVIEGLAIAALAVGATDAYLATKRSFVPELAAVRRAALEMGAAGMLGDLNLSIVEGPEEYLFGEEKALLEVIEGRDPLPTLLPPWQRGLFATVQLGWEADVSSRGPSGQSNPTLVNNVETLASAAHILARGATWFRSMGTVDSPGTVIVTIVGDVARARVLEVELGTRLSVVLDQCGGPRAGRRFVAAISGVSNPILTADQLDVPLTYEDMEACGTGIGAAGFAVFDDEADMASVARELSRFLAVESCGQCPPCKTGSMEITDRLLAIEQGAGTDDDLAVINARLRTVTDANRCYLGTEERNVVSSMLRSFPEAFAARIDGTAGPLRPALVPLVKEIYEDGTVLYDERHVRKQPDWTYAPSTG